MTLAEFSRDFGPLIASIVALFLGVFGDRVRRWVSRPQLAFGVTDGPPDCHMTTATTTVEVHGQDGVHTEPRRARCYYLRVRIHNFGSSSAEDVEVVVTGVDRLGGDGEFHPWRDFLPLNLRWAHTREIASKRIAPGGDVPRYCDLGHVIQPSERFMFGEDPPWWEVGHPLPGGTVLALDVSVPPATGTHLLEPGTYILRLAVTASNASVVRRQVRLEISGDWANDEVAMRRNVSIALI